MVSLFGKKKKVIQPDLPGSIATLRESLTTLEKRERHLEKQVQGAVEEARRRNKNKDKRGALFQLKRKKMFEKQIEQLEGKRMNIETQIMALEAQAANKQIFNVMKQGKTALKASIGENDVDEVAEVMDDITEGIAQVDEISAAMSQPIGSDILDDDELEAELAAMDEELMNEELNSEPVIRDRATQKPREQQPVIDLPDVPVKPAAQETQAEREERELAELQALMG
jgi:charged multivesicular body protein 4